MEDLRDATVREFLGRDPGVVHHPERATISRLISILREIGVLEAELSQPLTSVQECMNEYRQYLVRQRGLSGASLVNYLSFVEQFLRGRFVGRELSLPQLCASDVTAFVKFHAANLSPGVPSFWSRRCGHFCATCYIRERSAWIWLPVIRAGIDVGRTGAHLFRHTLAVDLLRNGASLDEIGDVLGHGSPNTTALYAKVDVASLRAIALPWPGGAR